MLENHIFRYGFMVGYDVWIYHGKNANATVSSNVPKQNEGIPESDQMFDGLDNIINDGIEVDPVATESSNVQ